VKPVPVQIDLAAFSPTRGSQGADSTKKLVLPQKPLHLYLHMPVGMEPGDYVVRLENSFGTVFADRQVTGELNAGTTLVELVVDLTAAPIGSSTLMIRPPGLTWRSFPVTIE
jgi:hypothetical protein